ncbi:uncharacterized protein LOC131944460 [Physella acuta]|uniref:uncharacterized protein LOC131944460 n=1 Tax=Physella acuta TaxID=109671 RepID=UPI0027DB255D|nr:uncharacterized protein LOC131944460 [Physella acuta]XP_059161069.1 uncharacterized protein LOC131944460 [Physella acuta]
MMSIRHLQQNLSRYVSKTTMYKNDVIRFLATRSKFHGMWEPNDLKLQPDIPEYKALHIVMRGYDFPVLESYAKYLHKAVESIFKLESDAWATPAKSTEVRTFHQNSSTVNEKYSLIKYDRTVMVENIPTTTVPILLQFIRRHCPQGVEVSLKEPSAEEEEARYVPDYQVKELQTTKDAIASGKLRKK